MNQFEIIAQHSLEGSLILDTSTVYLPVFSQLFKGNFRRRFSHTQLQQNKSILENCIELYETRDIVTIPELQVEISQITGKLRELQEIYSSTRIRERYRGTQFRNTRSNIAKLVRTINQLERKIEENFLKPEHDHFYDALVDLAAYSADQFRLKSKGKSKNIRGVQKDYGTDEKIVACMLYNTLINLKSTTIATGDHDVKRIYLRLMSILLSDYAGSNIQLNRNLTHRKSRLVLVNRRIRDYIQEVIDVDNVIYFGSRKPYGELEEKVKIVKRAYGSIKKRSSVKVGYRR